MPQQINHHDHAVTEAGSHGTHRYGLTEAQQSMRERLQRLSWTRRTEPESRCGNGGDVRKS